MDYLAFDHARQRVWVPAGNTGSVDVIDAKTSSIARVVGFPTAEVERHGKKRTVGPSAVTLGMGAVYVGNRADSTICVVDPEALSKGACVALDSSPDGVAHVAKTREVWVTTPRDRSLRILDVASPGAPALKGKVALPGEPEGYAVDDARGVFFTNLEDADKTLVIDLEKRTVVSTWEPGCGEGGPKGLALDHAASVLFVACSDHVNVVDIAHDGALLSKFDAGAGVDNIDYVEARHELFVAAGKAAKLVIARFTAPGTLAPVATVPTAEGARNAVGGDDGVAWIPDSAEGKVLSVSR